MRQPDRNVELRALDRVKISERWKFKSNMPSTTCASIWSWSTLPEGIVRGPTWRNAKSALMHNVSLTRLILYVNDVSLLKVFYEAHFGLAVVEEIENEWVVFDAGTVELALHLAGTPYRDRGKSQQSRTRSNAKIIFSVTSGLIEFRQQLADAGVRMRGLKRYEGFPQLMCDGEDPEGNVFQISQID